MGLLGLGRRRSRRCYLRVVVRHFEAEMADNREGAAPLFLPIETTRAGLSLAVGR